MNKKQLIVAWVTGILISLVCVIMSSEITIGDSGLCGLFKYYPAAAIAKIIFLIIPLVIIGGLLIYTLRDKKKQKQILHLNMLKGSSCVVEVKEFLRFERTLICHESEKWKNPFDAKRGRRATIFFYQKERYPSRFVA